MNLSSYVVNTKMQKSVCNLFLIDLLESKQSIIIVVWVNFTSIFSPSVHHYFESSLDTYQVILCYQKKKVLNVRKI